MKENVVGTENSSRLTDSWTDYLSRTADTPPKQLLVRALELFGEDPIAVPKTAVDIGCGAGSDSEHLVSRGWKTLAIDKSPAAAIHLESRLGERFGNGLLTLQIESFEECDLPTASLIYAFNSLPFCSPEQFPALWKKIRHALSVNGRFVGTFFGDADSWSENQNWTFFTEPALRELFCGLTMEYFHVLDEYGPTAAGGYKRWNIFFVIAKKSAPTYQ